MKSDSFVTMSTSSDFRFMFSGSDPLIGRSSVLRCSQFRPHAQTRVRVRALLMLKFTDTQQLYRRRYYFERSDTWAIGDR